MNILLATDGSDSARLAVDFLMNFPFPKDSTATVLTVIDDRIFSHEDPETLSEAQSVALQEAEKIIQDESRHLVASVFEQLNENGWKGSTEVRVGDPVEEIIKTATEIKADLVILGSHGLTGVSHFLLGSVSERVLEYAHCSVLIVKRNTGLDKATGSASGQTQQPQWRMLVAYDDSEPSREALALCASLPLDKQTELTAVTVLPMVTAYRQDIQQQLNSIWQQKKHTALSSLEKAIAGLDSTMSNVSIEVREATDVADEILRIAGESATDLIIIGNKGKGAVKRFLLGSRTIRVARHSPCSVWAVRI